VSTPAGLLDALRATIAFAPSGAPAGNLTVGLGALDGRAVRAALVENRTASGAIGSAEAERLVALFKVATIESAPLVLYIDSAGAKVSEGLRALGAFRALFRAGLDFTASGAPMAAVLGRNCYGGSSMLAHLARRRLFSPATQLAMSGPAILAAQAGMSAIDEMFRAMAEAAMSPAARAAANPSNAVWEQGTDIAPWLRAALAEGQASEAPRERHDALARRFDKALAAPAMERVQRRDLERIYPQGYEAREYQGLLEGEGRRDGAAEAFVGLVGRKPVGAERAWRFAERVWGHAAQPPARLEVFLDCATHAGRLEDEKVVLSEFIADMSFALDHVARRGTHVGLTIVGQAGGGVYVALAAPARRVTSIYGADIQVLPGAAVAAILGEYRDSVPAFADYLAAGVADDELKLGFAPGTA
jgi:hypothetical protein